MLAICSVTALTLRRLPTYEESGVIWRGPWGQIKYRFQRDYTFPSSRIDVTWVDIDDYYPWAVLHEVRLDGRKCEVGYDAEGRVQFQRRTVADMAYGPDTVREFISRSQTIFHNAVDRGEEVSTDIRLLGPQVLHHDQALVYKCVPTRPVVCTFPNDSRTSSWSNAYCIWYTLDGTVHELLELRFSLDGLASSEACTVWFESTKDFAATWHSWPGLDEFPTIYTPSQAQEELQLAKARVEEAAARGKARLPSWWEHRR